MISFIKECNVCRIGCLFDEVLWSRGKHRGKTYITVGFHSCLELHDVQKLQLLTDKVYTGPFPQKLWLMEIHFIRHCKEWRLPSPLPWWQATVDVGLVCTNGPVTYQPKMDSTIYGPPMWWMTSWSSKAFGQLTQISNFTDMVSSLEGIRWLILSICLHLLTSPCVGISLSLTGICILLNVLGRLTLIPTDSWYNNSIDWRTPFVFFQCRVLMVIDVWVPMMLSWWRRFFWTNKPWLQLPRRA